MTLHTCPNPWTAPVVYDIPQPFHRAYVPLVKTIFEICAEFER